MENSRGESISYNSCSSDRHTKFYQVVEGPKCGGVRDTIQQLDEFENVTSSYTTVIEASSVTGIDRAAIFQALRIKGRKAGGSYWRFATFPEKTRSPLKSLQNSEAMLGSQVLSSNQAFLELSSSSARSVSEVNDLSESCGRSRNTSSPISPPAPESQESHVQLLQPTEVAIRTSTPTLHQAAQGLIERGSAMHGQSYQGKLHLGPSPDDYVHSSKLPYSSKSCVLCVNSNRGDPWEPSKMTFRVLFGDGSISWWPWDRALQQMRAFDEYCARHPRLEQLRAQGKVTAEFIDRLNREKFSKKRAPPPKGTVFINLKVWSYAWAAAHGLPHFDDREYFIEAVYTGRIVRDDVLSTYVELPNGYLLSVGRGWIVSEGTIRSRDKLPGNAHVLSKQECQQKPSLLNFDEMPAGLDAQASQESDRGATVAAGSPQSAQKKNDSARNDTSVEASVYHLMKRQKMDSQDSRMPGTGERDSAPERLRKAPSSDVTAHLNEAVPGIISFRI